MKSPKSKQNKDPLYDIWDQVPVDYYQSGIKKSFLQKIWHTQKINLAKQILENKSFTNCLDIGCASGYMISQISKIYPKVSFTAVDSYDKVIAHARKTYPKIKFQVANAEKLPFKNNQFDLLLCYETIEHVTAPIKALKEMKRVLKKGKSLILSMDSGNWLFRIVWFFWENTKGSVWKGAHLHPFNHMELENIIKKTGFKIEEKIFSHLGMEVTFVLRKI